MKQLNATRVAGEFLLIVAGVLTALGADAWRERRAEAEVADAYLEHLRADTRQNLALLDSAIAEQGTSYASVRIVRDMRGRGERIPLDTMRALIRDRRLLQPGRVQLVLGTIRAMVASPDVTLVSDARIRVAVLNYASRVELHLQELDGILREVNRAGTDLVVAWQADTGFEADGLSAWLAGRDDARTREALAHLWLDGGNALRVLGDLREATEALERALGEAG